MEKTGNVNSVFQQDNSKTLSYHVFCAGSAREVAVRFATQLTQSETKTTRFVRSGHLALHTIGVAGHRGGKQHGEPLAAL